MPIRKVKGPLAALGVGLIAACMGAVSLLPTEQILRHPNVHLILFGAWDALGESTEWTTLLGDPAFLGRLAEYGNAGATLVETIAPATPPGITDDSHIVGAIEALMASGSLAAPGDEDIYLVFLPPGVRSQVMVAGGNVNGYHSAAVFGHWYTYAIVSDHGADANVVASHELYEAITDPYLTGVHVKGATFPDNEVADVCEGDLDVIDSYSVQQVWSVAQAACQ